MIMKKSNKSFKNLLIALIIFVFSFSFIGIPYTNAEDTDKSKGTVSSDNLQLTKSAEDMGNGQYKINFKVDGDAIEGEKPKADIVIMIDVSGSMLDKVNNNSRRIDKVKEAVNKFFDTIDSTKGDKDIQVAVGKFSGIDNYWRKLTDSNTESWMNEVFEKNNSIPINGRRWNVTLYEFKFWYHNKLNGNDIYYRENDDKSQEWRYNGYGFKKDANGNKYYYKEGQKVDFGDNEEDSSEVCGFSTIDNAREAVKTLKVSGDNDSKATEGTNTESGIYRVGKILDEGRQDSTKHVLFFTDGLPTQADGMEYDGDSPEKFITAAKDRYDSAIKPRKDTNFYSVGFMQGLNEEEQNKAKGLLSYINNSGYYILDNADELNSKFEEIANSMIAHIYNTIATKAIIKDVVGDNFKLADSIDVLKVEGDIDKEHIKVDTSNNTIEFNIDEITSNGYSFSFLIDKKDPYYSASNVLTNNEATITYKDYKGNDKSGKFYNPKVDLNPLKGKITVEKELTSDSDGKNEDDYFSILLEGKDSSEKYNIDVKTGESKSMEYYMKAKSTDISNTLAYKDLNYLTVGEYNVYEFLPAYYELSDIQVSYDGNGYESIGQGGKVIIDKDHSDVHLKITNKKGSEDYWWDKKSKDNLIKMPVYER